MGLCDVLLVTARKYISSMQFADLSLIDYPNFIGVKMQ
jgi:hypothetical protein